MIPTQCWSSSGDLPRGNVWRTDDGGATWATISAAALPAAPVRAVTIHPCGRANWFYIGTEVGAFASEDRGVHLVTNQRRTSERIRR